MKTILTILLTGISVFSANAAFAESRYSFAQDECRATVLAVAEGLAVSAHGKVGQISVVSITETREYAVNITDQSGDPAWVDYRVILDNDELTCLVTKITLAQTGG